MSEFSDFTKLVLDRMETNPDEFEPGNRWDTLVRGLEAHAIGDTENRYAKTLWALPPSEVDMLLTKYRKLYLARIHKDMLRNIVSGADKERAGYQYDSGNDINPLKGHVLRGNSPLTTTAIANQALGALNTEFDKAYTKAEGAQVPMSAISASTGPYTSRYVLNRSQVEIAQRLNMTPWEYAKYAEEVAKRLNGGIE